MRLVFRAPDCNCIPGILFISWAKEMGFVFGLMVAAVVNPKSSSDFIAAFMTTSSRSICEMLSRCWANTNEGSSNKIALFIVKF